MLSKELYPRLSSKRGMVFHTVLELHASRTPEEICAEVLRRYPRDFASLRDVVGPHFNWQRSHGWYPAGVGEHPALAKEAKEAAVTVAPAPVQTVAERLAAAREALALVEREAEAEEEAKRIAQADIDYCNGPGVTAEELMAQLEPAE